MYYNHFEMNAFVMEFTKGLMFHRVITIVYKCSSYLQFWNLRVSLLTYPEIQALSLVEKTITKIDFNFDKGR